jgi:hypothetical protein
MLDDLVELATTVVHRDHSPELATHPAFSRAGHTSSTDMPPRRRGGSKSASISSAGDMAPPAIVPSASSGSKSPSPVATRGHRRNRSSASNPGDVPLTPSSPSSRALANALNTRSYNPDASITSFLGVVVLSFGLSWILRTGALTYTTYGRAEIAAVSDPDHAEDPRYVAGLFLWRIFVLGLYWFRGYDGKHPTQATPRSRLTHHQPTTLPPLRP